MEKLIENNLFGDGLIPVDQPLLIERYNNCLSDIGIKNTSLSFFHIDKWGWSPEIANEFKNKDYLSFGFANPFGIIITPDQKRGSIYHPFHSFDWDLMDTIFSVFPKQVNDITTQSGLWFELNQEMSTYRAPQDLLLIDNFSIKFYTPKKIIATSREQKKLVRQFYDESGAWADKDLHIKLLDSAEKYGDLRNRNFEITDLPYTKVSSFYTRAFSGLFIIRHQWDKKPILIFENNESTLSGDPSFTHLEYNINDPKLYDYLTRNNIIHHDLNYFKTDVFSVETLRDNLLINLVNENYPEEIINISSDRLRNKYIHMLSQDNKIPDTFYALEEIISSLKRNASLKIEDYPIDLKIALSYPNPSLKIEDKQIIWSIICKTSPIKDVLLQYLFDKNQFFADYKNWSEYKQDWAISLIKEHKHTMYNYKITKTR